VILLAQYLAEVIGAYATGIPPVSLDHYTTLELAALELGIMIPLHILGGFSLWRQKPWAYMLSATLAFTTFIVFIALSVSLVLMHYLYGRSNLPDMVITLIIAFVAAGFSFIIFRQVKN
jgi:branched-subunit amino acid ABC-type transport system permease component